MVGDPEADFPKDYRSARGNFIAACEKAHIDSIARVHPGASGPDGKPLFIDSAALGPRQGTKALLLIAGGTGWDGGLGSAVLTALLKAGVAPLADSRLVLVHALNPFGMAWRRSRNEKGVSLDGPAAAQSWSFEMLHAILTEDLSHVGKLRLLDLARGDGSEVVDIAERPLMRAIGAFMPAIDLRGGRLFLGGKHVLAEAKAVVTRALAGP